MEKLDIFKIKTSCSLKDNVKGIRKQFTDEEKIFAKDFG
jgi:hypothetical protein